MRTIILKTVTKETGIKIPINQATIYGSWIAVLISFILFLAICQKIYQEILRIKYRFKNIRSLDLFTQEDVIDQESGRTRKVFQYPKIKTSNSTGYGTISFLGVNPTLTQTKLNEKLEEISAALGTTIARAELKIKKLPFKVRNDIVFYKGNPSIIVDFTEHPPTKPFEVWIGKTLDNRHIVINAADEVNFIAVGQPGTGKTEAMRSILTSFDRSFANKKNVTVTKYYFGTQKTKTDFNDVEVINASVLEGLEATKDVLEEILVKMNDTENKHLQLKLKNIKEAFSHNHEIDISILVIDELSGWLSKEIFQEKAEQKLQQEVASLINKILKQGRSSGVYCVLGNQNGLSSGLLIQPRQSCAFKLVSRTATIEEAKSIAPSIPDESQSYRQGRFWLESPQMSVTIQTPLIK